MTTPDAKRRRALRDTAEALLAAKLIFQRAYGLVPGEDTDGKEWRDLLDKLN